MINIPEPFPTLQTDWRVNPAEWRKVLLADPCAYCGAKSTAVDHIQPRSANGPTTHTNLTGACKRCNSSKNYRTLLAFLSGHPIGHRRAIEWSRDPATIARHEQAQAEEHARKIRSERSDWLYNDWCRRNDHERTWGTRPPRAPYPEHLRLPEDQAA